MRLRLTEQPKRFEHPEVGPISLRCQPLIAEIQAEALLVYTATPNTNPRATT